MRPVAWILVGAAVIVGCSGDDARQHRITTPPTPPPEANASIDAGTATPPAPPAPAVASLTEDMGTPWFDSGDGKAAADRFALEDWTAAAAGFTKVKAAMPATDKQMRGRAALLVGIAKANKGQWESAATSFAEARAALPVLSDYISYQEARADYFAHETDRALELAKAVSADSTSGADAELLVGDLIRDKGDAMATAAHYRDYLTRRPNGIRRSEARFRMAEALLVQGSTTPGALPPLDLGVNAEAIAALRAITVEDPLSSWATKAQERLDALVKQGSKLAAAPLTATELVARGMVYFDNMRNPEGEADFVAALAAADVTPEQKCVASYHRAQSLFKARDRRAAAPAFDESIAACKLAKNADLEIRGNYQAGRAYAFHGDHTTAIARYQAAQKIDATHSFTDDSLLREAEEWADLGEGAKVTAALERLTRDFPTGDMRAEAMWRLGWRAYRDSDDKKAIGYWEKQIAAAPVDDNYWAEGQAQYWIGRAQERRGKRDLALASWQSCIESYPVSYYAMLALDRIREVDEKKFAEVFAKITADPPGYDPKAPAFTFQPRAEYATPGFARAVELIKLGLGDQAEAELRTLGLVAPGDKKRVDDPDKVEKLWAMAWLYDRAGRYATSHWPTRWHILDYKRQWPVGANDARWRIAYPRPYLALLSEHAKKNNVVLEVLQAIVREESAFDPLRESYANAIGLTQMVNSTATRFAKGTGIAPTRENLRDPEKNVTIGARFLGFLFSQWNGFIHLVPPSYNGGEGYVKKVLKTRGTWPADEVIESIVDDQIRNYSKRVLGSFFAYTWIYKHEVPPMPNTIPPELLAK